MCINEEKELLHYPPVLVAVLAESCFCDGKGFLRQAIQSVDSTWYLACMTVQEEQLSL